jgi:hypothetical protein
MPEIISAAALTEDELGRLLRQATIDVSLAMGLAKPDYLLPYDNLDDQAQELHKRVANIFMSSILERMETRELLEQFPLGTTFGLKPRQN